MIHLYDIAIIGPGAAAQKAKLQRRIKQRLKDLGSELPSIVRYLSASSIEQRNIKSPLVAVYFGGASHSSQDIDAVRSISSTGNVIIPVVDSLANFQSQMPPELHAVNGLEASDSKALNIICNLVLENLGLLRKTRRLFISYKRDESGAAALQLKHELDLRGYDVFLDTHSVPKGDNFQEVLWHRLTDSDVVVILDTPKFLASRWTKEELSQAAALTIGIVQVVWPDHEPADYTALCDKIYLKDSCLSGPDGDKIIAPTLKTIVDHVEKIRARSVAARHDNIVQEFCDAAKTVSVDPHIQPQRFITFKLASGQTASAIPAVGVVDAARYHEAHRQFIDAEAKPSFIFLIYDHRGLRTSWGEFLDFLDEFLPVKALRITNVAEKLRAL